MWLRLLLASLLASSAGAAFAEDPPATGRRTIPLGLQQDNGIGSKMEWNWTLAKEPAGKTVPAADCVRPCNGRKHPKHSDCDLSCDSVCPSVAGSTGHVGYVNDRVEELDATQDRPPARSHADTLSRDFTTFHLPSTLRGEHTLGSLQRRFRQAKSSDRDYIEFSLPHWNMTPCSASTARVEVDSYLVTVQYSITDTDVKPDGSIAKSQGPTGTLRWRLIVPIKDRISYGDSVVNCRCEATQTPPKETGFLPGNRGEGAYAYVGEMGMMRPMTGTDLKSAITGIAVQDMNYATISFMPMTMRDYYIPDGWELECMDGDAQDVQLIDWTYLVGRPNFEFASIDDFQTATQEKKLRVLCLNIDKPEPKPGMTYRLVPPKNPLVSRLAAVTKSSRIRGPWDQMRLWIVTDAAPYDKIAKALIPSPGPGTYVREMYRAASARAFSPFDDRYRPMMEYRHLLAKNYDPSAVAWYLGTKLRQNTPGTLDWFRSSGSDVAAIFGQGSPKEEAELVGVLASALANVGGEEGLKTALWLMTQATPEANRAAVAESNGARNLSNLLSMPLPASSAHQILDWLASAKPTFAGIAASSLHPDLPAEVQAKAATLRKSLPKTADAKSTQG